MPDKLQALYDNLVKTNPDFKVTPEQFRQDMQDENKLKTLHTNLGKNYPDFKVGYDQFKSDMWSTNPQPEAATAPAPVNNPAAPTVTATQPSVAFPDLTPEGLSFQEKAPTMPGKMADLFPTGTQPGVKPVETVGATKLAANPINVFEEKKIAPAVQQMEAVKPEEYFQEGIKQIAGAAESSAVAEKPKGPAPTGSPVLDYIRNAGNAFVSSGKTALAETSMAIVDQVNQANDLLKKVSDNPTWQRLASNVSATAAEDMNNLRKFKEEANTLTGKPGEMIGSMIPFAGLAAASIIAKSPALAATTTGLFAEMGYGSGIEAYDQYKKSEGQQSDPIERAGTGILYGAAMSVPISGYLGKLMPKGLFQKSLSGVLSANPEATAALGKQIFENFAKKSPGLAKRLLEVSAKGAAHGVATMEAMELSKKAVDDFVIGKDVTLNDYLKTAVDAAQSGAIFGLMTAPFSVYAQSVANVERRKAQGSVTLTMDAKGRPVEVIPTRDGGQQGLTPEGRTIEVTPDMAKNAVIIPTPEFDNFMQIHKETGTVPETFDRDAYAGRARDVLDRIAGESGYIHVATDPEGNKYFVTSADETGAMRAVDINGTAGDLPAGTPVKTLPKGAVYTELLKEFDKAQQAREAEAAQTQQRNDFITARDQASQTVQQNFQQLAQPDGNLHTGVDKDGNEVIIMSQTPGGMAVLQDGRMPDINELKDVKSHTEEEVLGQQMAEFDAANDPDLQPAVQPQAQSVFNWNGRNMQLVDVSDKNNMLVQEIDAEGEPVGRPENMSMADYNKIIDQQVSAPEQTPELRTYDIAGKPVPFTPQADGSLLSESMNTPEEAEAARVELEKQIGANNTVTVNTVPGTDSLAPSTYQVTVTPKTGEEPAAQTAAPEPTDKLFKEGEASYMLNGQPIEHGKAMARVKAAIFVGDRKKIENLEISGDKEMTDMIDKAFPVKITIGKKKASQEDALNWIDSADSMDELRKLSIEGAPATSDIRTAYALKVKELTPEISPEDVNKLTSDLFAPEIAPEVQVRTDERALNFIPIRSEPKTPTENAKTLSGMDAKLADIMIEDVIKSASSPEQALDKIRNLGYSFRAKDYSILSEYIQDRIAGKNDISFPKWRLADTEEQLFEQPIKTEENDNRNIQGLPSGESRWETTQPAGPDETGGGSQTAAGGNVQGNGQVEQAVREEKPVGGTEVRAEDQRPEATTEGKGLKKPSFQRKKKVSPSKLVDLYKTRLTKLKKANPHTYWSVDLPSDEDLLSAAKDGRLIDMAGGMAYVTKDGDMKGLFKYDPEAHGTAKVLQAERIKMGGIKLDAYDTEGTGEVSLVPTYKKNGFREVARVDFNPEYAPEDMPESIKSMNPDVVAMVYDPENKLDIKVRRFNKDQYEDALAYRDSYITEEQVPDHNKSADTQAFFSDVVTGTSDKFKPKKPWEPILEFSAKEEAVRPVFEKFNGNFDTHIATSIPAFRDVQIKVVSAINEMYGDKGGLIYDIGGSEGGFVKAITELSDGKMKSINLDANGDMEAVHNASPVEGSKFVKEAFGEGFEWDGVTYPRHEPKQKADVVHESMTFQFIDEKRADKVAEVVNNYLKPDGLFITEEKVHPASQAQWAANEAKKDKDFKSRYYEAGQISAKKEEVLTGMVTNQTTYDRYKNELRKKFDYVEEYWDGGNFKGLVASNDRAKVDQFLAEVGNTDTEFSEKNINPEGKPVSFKKKTSETIDVDGVKRPTLNSNGQPIHPTEEGIRNFWRWFGDSKVVDKEGRPLVAYHGTDASFEEFRTKLDKKFTTYARIKNEATGRYEPEAISTPIKGAFFTDKYEGAKAYSDKGNVITAYLKLERPYSIDAEGEKDWIVSANIPNAIFHKNDGLLVKNTYDGKFTMDQYVAFESNQIKSATDNTGTFAKEDARISFKKKPFSLNTLIKEAAAETDTNPTEAQIEAGNYKKGHVDIQGMDISIENPKGSTRSGTDEDGKAWETKMKSHYGYFKGSIGKDGDHIDVFIGPKPENETIYVVDQNNPKTGEFDESKVMLGYESAEQAKEAYLANYEPGWTGFGKISEVPADKFKTWLYDGARQRKPFSEYVDVKRIQPVPEFLKDYKAPEFKKRPVEVDGVQGEDLELQSNLAKWEEESSMRTPVHVPGNEAAADAIHGTTTPKFEQAVRDTEFWGMTHNGEIYVHPTTPSDVALVTWAHEKSHIVYESGFENYDQQIKFSNELYDALGPAEIRRVLPREYWFEDTHVQAGEYLAALVEDVVTQGGLIESAPDFVKSIIFDQINQFSSVKYLQDEKQRLDNRGKQPVAGETVAGGVRKASTDRTGEEGVSDRGVPPAQEGKPGINKVFSFEDLFEPSFKKTPETIDVDGVKRPTMNSNGQPIHPTEEGIRNFWRWFGDSKVVDKEGRPLVMYHQTNREFTSFKPNFGTLGRGVYFSDVDKIKWYGKISIPVYLKANKVIDAESVFEETGFGVGAIGADRALREEGFDGITAYKNSFGETVVFEPTQIKSATGNEGGFDPTDPRISFKRKAELKPERKQVQTTGEKIREILVNNKLALENWMNDVQTVVPKIEDYENPLLKDALAKSKVTNKLRIFEKGPYKELINSVANVLKTSGISKEELSRYLIAVHGVERNEKFWNAQPDRVGEDFSGLTELKEIVRTNASDAEKLAIDGMNNEAFAEYYQKQIEDKLDPAQVKALWGSIRSISKLIRDEMLDSGMISREYYDELNTMYKNYIPLRAWETSNPEDFEFSRGVGSYTEPIIRAKGRKSLAEDPLATLLQMANTAYISGERNRVKRAAGELVRNNAAALKDVVQYNRTYFVDEGIDSEGNPIIRETIDRPDQTLFDQGKVTSKVPKQYTARRTSAQAKEFEVEFYQNGRKYVLVFQGSDPAVARAINNREASVGLDYLNKVVSTDIKMGKVTIPSITKMSRYLSSINTTYSVDFPLVNFVRDAPMAMLSEWVYGDAKQVAKMFPNMKRAEAAMRRSLQGKADPANNADDAMLEDFFAAGGPTGFAFLKNVDEFKQSIANDVRRINRIKNPLVRMEVGFRKGLDLVGQLAEWSETITRFGVYLNHVEAGESKEKAALAAKNATVNFDQKGRISPALNGLYTFFNAAVQAVDKYFKLWGKNPYKMAGIHMFLIVQGLLNAMMLDLFGDEDEDGVRAYDKVSDYTKKNNLVIPVPGSDKTVSIAVPQILRKFHAIGFDAYDLLTNRKTATEVMLDELASIPSDISPIDTDSFLNKDGDISVKPLVPSIMRPIVELEANENFMKLPIVPEPFSIEMAHKIADTRRAYKDVNKIAQWTTDKLYQWGGGDETGFKYVYKDGELRNIPALLDISPESIEHLFESYFGGVGKLVNRTWKTTGNIFSAGKKLYEGENFKEAVKEIDINTVPVANRFVRTPFGDPLQKEFRKVRNDMENKIKVLDQAEKDGDWVKFDKMYQEIGGKINDYKAIMTTFENLDKVSLQISKQNKAAGEELKKEMREQMKEIIKLK